MMVTNIILPIFLFGALVFIHELGHFVVAKFSGVFVERFALGFGPVLIKKKWGETEYAICLFPLGGYVKMLGEDPDEAKEAAQNPRSFAAKPVLTRTGIVIMGPVFNLILPILVFGTLFLVGTPVPTASVGSLIPGYPAQKAGMREGDKIINIENQPVQTWNQMTQLLRNRAGQKTNVTVDRQGKIFDLSLTPVEENVPNIYGELQLAGRIGVDLQPYKVVVGIKDVNSIAAKQGLITGDIITAINNTSISYWWMLDEFFSQRNIVKQVFIQRKTKETFEQHTLSLPAGYSLKALGIESGEMYIREVMPGSIAQEKGLQAGDKLISLNEKKLTTWQEFKDQIQNNQGSAIQLGIFRNGKNVKLDVIPKEIQNEIQFSQKQNKTRQLGVLSCAIPSEPDTWLEQYHNPWIALKRGFQETVELSVATLGGLGKLVSGQLSLNTLGGPISIFYLAGSSYKVGGWTSFFRMMAILSITLGILNLLPIPILDGGHLFFFFIEAIQRRPVSMKVRQISQQVGFFMIAGLMILVFYVDINRFFVGWFKSLFN